MLIRKLMEEDLPAVLEIEQQVYPFPWSRQIFTDTIESGALLVVVEDGQRVKGYAVLSTGGGEAQLFNIAVSPDSQGRGLGRELLQWLIEQAKQQQAEMLFLEVRLSNQVAQLLYLDMGFNEIGLRKRYYRCNGGGREDALIYALQLQSENYFNLS